MHDSTLANAREQAANILKNAKEEAEKLKADAIKYSESVRESLRRDLQRAIDAV
jgi:F0F1-type ATP synthase membrane subunit b/b'